MGPGYGGDPDPRLSEDLPLVIEVVDTEDKITAFLPVLDEMVSDGLVTLERVQVQATAPSRLPDRPSA